MNRRLSPPAAALLAAAAGFLTALGAMPNAHAADDASIARGRYIAKIAGCNDCHTPGYAMTGGQVPEKDWLVGDHLGWKGAWGTTYPANLRLALAKVSEDEWVRTAKTKPLRPPMPWFALRDMNETDLRAFYRFVRSLGEAGAPVPAYVPPDQSPKGPVVTFPEPPAPAQKSASR
jgi:mono/diheme cytochrome c family protein